MNLAQIATQPVGGFATWSSAEWVVVIAAVASAVTGIIVATKANTKATAAQTSATANSGRLDRQSTRMDAVEKRTFQTALALPPSPPTEPKP